MIGDKASLLVVETHIFEKLADVIDRIEYPEFIIVRCWIIGLCQQFPVKPALAGLWSIIFANSFLFDFVNFEGFPGGFFVSNPCNPRSRKASNLKRTDSTETLSMKAISFSIILHVVTGLPIFFYTNISKFFCWF